MISSGFGRPPAWTTFGLYPVSPEAIFVEKYAAILGSSTVA